jgi:hypothetical protein
LFQVDDAASRGARETLRRAITPNSQVVHRW